MEMKMKLLGDELFLFFLFFSIYKTETWQAESPWRDHPICVRVGVDMQI